MISNSRSPPQQLAFGLSAILFGLFSQMCVSGAFDIEMGTEGQDLQAASQPEARHGLGIQRGDFGRLLSS
jgi:hypothetical protein